MKIIRSQIFHTPKNPFEIEDALEHYQDGALAFEGELIVASGNFVEVSKRFPDAELLDAQGTMLLPGMVDLHVHLPQIPVIGAMGLRLLEWLQTCTLPTEEQFEDVTYAKEAAQVFLKQLARNGTTTALVFGAHFAEAMDVFFEEALESGLRITCGLCVSDRMLTDKLHITPEQALKESQWLIDKWHGQGRLRYAVTPRFSLSCTDDMLAVCGKLLAENPDIFFTSHINEQSEEISTVLGLFEGVKDYLETYERHQLINSRSVLAHNVHPYDSELARLAQTKASVAHCPSSNMFIGSGLFALRRHLQHGVNVGLGSDVGGGTGFSIYKEGLMAYQGQMLQEDGFPLGSSHLLYLATAAGARALHLSDVIGDFTAGKQADFILLHPPKTSTLAQTLRQSPSLEASLAAVFTLAREDCIKDVYVGGKSVLY